MSEHPQSQDAAVGPSERADLTYPHLPVELVREILELAAQDQRKWDAFQLLLVSRTVRRWITPLVYSHIDFHTAEDTTHLTFPFDAYPGTYSEALRVPPKMDALLAALQDSELAMHVRSLDLACPFGYAQVPPLLRAFPRLKSLTALVELVPHISTDRPGELAAPSFVRLLHMDQTAHFDTSSLLFRKTTHVSIGGLKINPNLGTVFPVLTHLAFHWDNFDFSFQDPMIRFLSNLLTLFSTKRDLQQMVVVILCEGNPVDNQDQEPWSYLSLIPDERLVLWPVWTPEEVAETFRLVGPELWQCAEEKCGNWRDRQREKKTAT